MRRLLAAAVLLLAGCQREAPCPKDAELIERLRANEQALARLVKSDSEAERQRLGIEMVHRRGPGAVELVAWSHDFFGPGGVYKGYLYSEEKPRELVPDIDALTDPPVTPETKHLVRHVQGNWYLFFESSN